MAFRGGIDLDAQLLPEGDQYVRIRDARTRVAAARREVLAWKDGDERRAALALLDALAFEAKEQTDVFTRRDGVDLPASVSERVFGLLGDTADP